MSQQRLNELILLFMEKEMLNEIDYDNLQSGYVLQRVQKIKFI